MATRSLEVGIVGAGVGGLMAAIAIASAGGNVKVLEAAEQLGEIGAGIQMTPNAARLLIRYGVDKVIGNNLVRFHELNLRRKDGSKIGGSSVEKIENALGYPWWLVHRHHLHTGLVDVARQNGAEIITSSRVATLEKLPDGKISVITRSGEAYRFDLLIGSDGLHSIVRQNLFPSVTPKPLTGNCAYRAVVPYEEIRQDPLTRSLVEDGEGKLKKTMEVWTASTGYIIAYPISGAKEYNMVLSHFTHRPVETTQDVDIEEVKRQYRDYDPQIYRVIKKIRHKVSRWPLLVTGPLESWSSPEGNIVLIGDAAHSMTNHMAQGAATSMEDGVFLARCLRLVVDGTASIADAVELYEQGRMPKATYKQQLSFLNGWLWHLPDGPAQCARDKAMQSELHGDSLIRSPNLYADPVTIRECYGYDAEQHADDTIATWLNRGQCVRDQLSTVVQSEADKVVNWFLPEGHKFQIRPKI